jgi:DNA replication protein DnaC
MDYGNLLCPLVDLLTKRYDLQLFTLVTTNLTPAEIRAWYGDRIADRLNEMMLKIVFTNESYRSR